MFCWAFSLTAILGTVRCIVIHYPFYRINKALVLSIAVGMAFFTLGLYLSMHFADDEHIWSSYTLQLFARSYYFHPTQQVEYYFGATKATSNMLISLGTAALSVWGLRRADAKSLENKKENGKKRGGREAAVTIAYLNILIGLQFILNAMAVVIQQKLPKQLILLKYMYFLAYPLANTLISAVNPLIYIVRSSKIRQALFNKTPSPNSTMSISMKTPGNAINNI